MFKPDSEEGWVIGSLFEQYITTDGEMMERYSGRLTPDICWKLSKQGDKWFRGSGENLDKLVISTLGQDTIDKMMDEINNEDTEGVSEGHWYNLLPMKENSVKLIDNHLDEDKKFREMMKTGKGIGKSKQPVLASSEDEIEDASEDEGISLDDVDIDFSIPLPPFKGDLPPLVDDWPSRQRNLLMLYLKKIRKYGLNTDAMKASFERQLSTTDKALAKQIADYAIEIYNTVSPYYGNDTFRMRAKGHLRMCGE
jgi:hypothetical protein